ncbi:ABC transporter permease [Priestia koreensis]|uniref:ABC transporter permease n=1 Tax=Priestia koreensis TaxID=284581 RepID=UPI0028F72BDA|nr:ABC transporter permease [Priestia koreensis]
MSMLAMQCKSEIIRILRNRYYVFWSLCMPLIFYYIFTNVVNTNPSNQGEWNAHYLMSMTSFSVMGSAIMTLGIRMVQERTTGWSVYIRTTPLSDTVYFIAQMVGQTVIHCFSVLVIFIVGGLVNHIELSFTQWVFSGLWIILASIPFLGLGTLIGSMKRVETASGISNVIYMVLAVCGGMWMPVEIMPKVMQSVAHWLPSFNYGNGAWNIVQGHAPEWKSLFILMGYFVVFMLLSKYIRRNQEVV